MIKFFIGLVLAFFCIIGLAGYSLVQSNVEDIIVCATNDNSHYIPSSVCDYYVVNYRLGDEDIAFLSAGAGLNFLIGVPDVALREKYIRLLVERGISINSSSQVDGMTPLTSAILLNDPVLVQLLTDLGADPRVLDKKFSTNAFGVLSFLQDKQPSVDRAAILSPIIAALAKPPSQ
ncbi:hypothetical protein ACVFI8_11950 [Agarivorans sp. MS3-6]|uniref:hypothetical protein n=1 Tax=Agarivorans sp. TSD2052 TaxID=2937286 RepID=UPI00200D9228|nr:hypothetical protein [Agarivorans sp. TSD2052]UPW18321.1 hypothetical protein M0C34_19180 [Agarivorans sp. TSD2052]